MNPCGPTDTPDDFDINALREKYAQERAKRLRPEGGSQYLELEGDFAEFYEIDPYTPVTERDPVAENVGRGVLSALGASMMLAGLPAPRNAPEEVDAAPAGRSAPGTVRGTCSAPPYGSRAGWRPKTLADYGDGGSYPEIASTQFPLDMGRKVRCCVVRSDPCRV